METVSTPVAPVAPVAPFALAEFLPYRLSVVTERVSRLIARAYAERFGLSISEWRCVAHLGQAADLSASALAERTAMDKVKVSRALTRLRAKRLVRRESDPRDQRGSRLSLTPSGRAVYEAIVPAALDMERLIVAGLDASDVRSFMDLLSRIEDEVARLAASR